MPCHTAYHETDPYASYVDGTRKAIPRMLWMIKRIGGVMNEYSYLQASPLYDELMELMREDPKLRLVQVKGFMNEVDDPNAAKKITRLKDAAYWYTALNSLVTAELCRLCWQAEHTPGKILQGRELAWWNKHRNSRGHDHDSSSAV